ncbi:HDIG domain-containing protein [Candidatus Woesearchaeota archaeon]|jgi:uncharacterized protein|nr:HDIG domain-containing protein [Candidatus Woesearchaeota archaeon]MBT5272258.1 HDIG domain-containing protein [Candidatus Woesearchaeota archaeon]MBT6041149.1 HDIG domain-containing protein [Candidatus Woesearchaeota archaeon]MBT6336530.1 HDIG domain-containing protein [Candidatus Woesearchaeota archaeon]MBT7927420.1 HDIG domain-containing protein [Candidatus Woesearchaeota archaeon]
MEFNEQKALELMEKYAPDKDTYEKVMAHTMAVQEIALEISEKIEVIDIEFIKTAVILHDIGRFKLPPWSKDQIKHGVEGANILKAEGWPEKFQRVCENHIGVGILKKDIEKDNLPLPAKDYIPETKEEIIITYADNLTINDQRTNEEEIEERYRKKLGEEHAKRVGKFHEKVHEMIHE